MSRAAAAVTKFGNRARVQNERAVLHIHIAAPGVAAHLAQGVASLLSRSRCALDNIVEIQPPAAITGKEACGWRDAACPPERDRVSERVHVLEELELASVSQSALSLEPRAAFNRTERPGVTFFLVHPLGIHRLRLLERLRQPHKTGSDTRRTRETKTLRCAACRISKTLETGTETAGRARAGNCGYYLG